MPEPMLTFTRLAGDDNLPLLVVGPSLGTSVEALWDAAASRLGERFEVVGWDLPGHGRSKPATEPFTVAELAAVVHRAAADLADGEVSTRGRSSLTAPARPPSGIAGRAGFARDERTRVETTSETTRPAAYAGVSLGGAVALELALDPGPFSATACIASASKLGDPTMWHERAGFVRTAGTPAMVEGSTARWFAPGFVGRDPATADRLLHSLSDADDDSYARCCEALAEFDLTPRLAETRVPVLVLPGEHDVVVPPDVAQGVADAIPDSVLHVAQGCAHLPPAEDPAAVAETLLTHLTESADG